MTFEERLERLAIAGAHVFDGLVCIFTLGQFYPNRSFGVVSWAAKRRIHRMKERRK